MVKITAYYKFEKLSEETRKQNKIRSNKRLDCSQFTDDKGRLTNFVNSKDQLFAYLTEPYTFVKASTKRMADWALTNSTGGNLTSLFTDDIEFPQYYYGYPDKSKRSPFANDGYLFVANDDMTVIELFIIENGRNLISAYYQELIDGTFNSEMQQLRNQAKPFFDYWKATSI